MNKEKIYRPPVTTIVFMQEEPMMALSAKTGKHTLDEGMETVFFKIEPDEKVFILNCYDGSIRHSLLYQRAV